MSSKKSDFRLSFPQNEEPPSQPVGSPPPFSFPARPPSVFPDSPPAARGIRKRPGVAPVPGDPFPVVSGRSPGSSSGPPPHPSGSRADPTERSLNSAVMSPQEWQASRTQGLTSSREPGWSPLGCKPRGYGNGWGGYPSPSPGKDPFCLQQSGQFLPGEGQPQKSPTTRWSFSMPFSTSDLGWVRILAKATAWQGVATTPIFAASPGRSG